MSRGCTCRQGRRQLYVCILDTPSGQTENPARNVEELEQNALTGVFPGGACCLASPPVLSQASRARQVWWTSSSQFVWLRRRTSARVQRVVVQREAS